MTKKERRCECGGRADIVRKDYRFTESGLGNVWLKDIEVVICRTCASEAPRIPSHDDLMRTIAVAIIDKPSELAGDEVRFLRKYLGKHIGQFAQMLGMDRSHLSRIENRALAISRQTDRLVRTVALVYDPSLTAKLKQLGRQSAILERLREIEPEATPVQMQLGLGGRGYTYSLKTAA